MRGTLVCHCPARQWLLGVRDDSGRCLVIEARDLSLHGRAGSLAHLAGLNIYLCVAHVASVFFAGTQTREANKYWQSCVAKDHDAQRRQYRSLILQLVVRYDQDDKYFRNHGNHAIQRYLVPRLGTKSLWPESDWQHYDTFDVILISGHCMEAMMRDNFSLSHRYQPS